MRALLQRTHRAEVRVGEEVVGAIAHGLVILLGIGVDDEENDAIWLAKKCAELRIFNDHKGRLNRSLLDVKGEALVVSQFTLYGDSRKGRRPSYTRAAQPEKAVPLLEIFCRQLEETGVQVAQGRFGAHMEVDLVNDGPVTLMVESPGR
jgi:D-tyrosyl-tRNA(Tyr) deacylase